MFGVYVQIHRMMLIHWPLICDHTPNFNWIFLPCSWYQIVGNIMIKLILLFLTQPNKPHLSARPLVMRKLSDKNQKRKSTCQS